jgi:hypothetical protein
MDIIQCAQGTWMGAALFGCGPRAAASTDYNGVCAAATTLCALDHHYSQEPFTQLAANEAFVQAATDRLQREHFCFALPLATVAGCHGVVSRKTFLATIARLCEDLPCRAATTGAILQFITQVAPRLSVSVQRLNNVGRPPPQLAVHSRANCNWFVVLHDGGDTWRALTGQRLQPRELFPKSLEIYCVCAYQTAVHTHVIVQLHYCMRQEELAVNVRSLLRQLLGHPTLHVGPSAMMPLHKPYRRTSSDSGYNPRSSGHWLASSRPSAAQREGLDSSQCLTGACSPRPRRGTSYWPARRSRLSGHTSRA